VDAGPVCRDALLSRMAPATVAIALALGMAADQRQQGLGPEEKVGVAAEKSVLGVTE
jgi:hypothetical protein